MGRISAAHYSDEMLVRVFVSYKSEDRKRVRALVSALQEAGFDAWWDQDISAGSPWEDVIQRELVSAACILVCWTECSIAPLGGAKVQVEAREGLNRNKLVQIRLDSVEPPLFFRQFQVIDFRDWSGLTTAASFQQLTRALGEVCGGRQSVRPPKRRLFTLGNLRRYVALSRTLFVAWSVIVVLSVGALLGTSERARAHVCDWRAIPVVCHPPYDLAQLPDEHAQRIRRVREVSELAERSAVRARDAEARANQAATSADAGTGDTAVRETEYFLYRGGWVDGQATGFGVQKWKTASPGIDEVYAGQFRAWVRVMGVYVYPPIAANTAGISRYEGEWAPGPKYSKGNWNGKAVVRFLDGAIYVGEVREGNLDGLGMMVTKSGERLEGQWRDFKIIPETAVRWKSGGQLQSVGQ